MAKNWSKIGTFARKCRKTDTVFQILIQSSKICFRAKIWGESPQKLRKIAGNCRENIESWGKCGTIVNIKSPLPADQRCLPTAGKSGSKNPQPNVWEINRFWKTPSHAKKKGTEKVIGTVRKQCKRELWKTGLTPKKKKLAKKWAHFDFEIFF